MSLLFFKPASPFMGASLVAQLVKNLPAMQETLVQFLGRKHPLEESMATRSIILAWTIPMDRGAWWATVHRAAKSGTRLTDSAQHSPAKQLPRAEHCAGCCPGAMSLHGNSGREVSLYFQLNMMLNIIVNNNINKII